MKLHDGERIVVDTPAGQRWRLAVMGLVLTGAAAWLAVGEIDGDLGLVVGILGLVLFGPLTVTLLLRALRRTPVLVLDAAGFTDHATASAVGWVAWQDVHSIDERMFMGRVFVAVTVRDPSSFRRGLPVWRRALGGINRHLVEGDVLIPENVLPMSAQELARTMRSLRHDSHGRPDGHGQPARA
jgi:hypothetical protein